MCLLSRCEPCPAAAPCAVSAGIKSGLRDGKPIDGKQEHPCPCRTCCCGKPPIAKPCYKQPRIPDSYAPRRCYARPTAPVDANTTYKMSYLPMEGCKNLRGVMRKPPPNLVPSCEPMEGCTVQKMSFLPNPVCVTQPIRPCHHDMWGQGPMQNITTQRHDFVPKPCVLRESFKPPPKFHCVEQPFENRTINKLSYLPPERVEVTKSYAPDRCYERPAAKMDSSTTHKMSFMPNKIGPKEILPWACKGQYQKPCQKLDINTTYMMSYLDAASDCRRRAIIPDSCMNPVTPNRTFESATVYKNSYLPTSSPIPCPIKPLPNLVPSTAQMEGDTVQKLSFLPNPVCVTQPIRPCHHDMWGQGPMQNITTQRHDFVPKPTSIRESCKPPPKYHCVEQPFENRTVNRMSYINPGRIAPPESYAPMKCYEKPAGKCPRWNRVRRRRCRTSRFAHRRRSVRPGLAKASTRNLARSWKARRSTVPRLCRLAKIAHSTWTLASMEIANLAIAFVRRRASLQTHALATSQGRSAVDSRRHFVTVPKFECEQDGVLSKCQRAAILWLPNSNVNETASCNVFFFREITNIYC